MIIQEVKTIEILDFENILGIELVVKTRSLKSNLPLFYVKFPNLEIATGIGTLVSTYGNGSTIDEALSDYAKELSEGKLVINAYTSERREIDAPILVHTKLLGK